jgi:hypothetical protein
MSLKYFLDSDGVRTGRMGGKPGCGHIEIAHATEQLDRDGDVCQQMFKLGYVRVLETDQAVWVDALRDLTKGQKRFLDGKESAGKEVTINSAEFIASRG